MGGLAGLAARIIGIEKIIYTNHGWTFNEDRSVLQKLLIKLFSWLIVFLSHETIVLSEKEMNDVRNWVFIKDKTQKIPLGIEEPKFIEKEEARSNLIQLANIVDRGQKIILSIGELTKNKGYIYALGALKKYEQPFTYLIIGAGELKNFLQEKIKEFDLESNVKLLNFIPDASRYLKGCDFLLLPSIKEGLPYVILEAGFAEIPVIATNVGGICELVKNTDDKNILIEAKSPDSILNSIKNEKYFYAKKLNLKDMAEKTIEIMLSQ
jgi:glycosyltransferase involved in cell wall biosynthesis